MMKWYLLFRTRSWVGLHHVYDPRHLLPPSILLVLIPVLPARARVARSVSLASHRLHPLIATIVSSKRCGCRSRTNFAKKTVHFLHSTPRSPSPPDDCSSATYVWKRCPMIQSLVMELNSACHNSHKCDAIHQSRTEVERTR
jgi:hypothetical protein